MTERCDEAHTSQVETPDLVKVSPMGVARNMTSSGSSAPTSQLQEEQRQRVDTLRSDFHIRTPDTPPIQSREKSLMHLIKRFGIYAALSVVASSATAQEFPEGSTAPAASELRQIIAGKVFSVKTSTSTWRLQINDNGYFYVNVGSFADSGTWSAEDGKWCTKPQKGNASCNEMRLAVGALLMKRDNGEIVRFAPQ